MTQRAIIAGGGIGGLTAALALHAAGVESVVLEAAREIRPLGVGINLLPHAVRELIRLGLGDDLAGLGIATAENVYCEHTGKRRFTEPRGLEGGYDCPQYSIHRGRLQMLLLNAALERGVEVRTGVRVDAFSEDRDSVRVTGSPAGADVLIGADGLHSAIRARLHPGPDPLLWSGVQMWRGVTAAEPFLTGRSMVIVRNGMDEFIAYPIGDRLINWVALRPVADPGRLPGSANWNAPGQASDLLPHFAWNLGWLDVADLIDRCERIFEYPMVDRDPLPSWGTNRVTLLGDAAHPMYPVGANGASQAIVDAAVLADTLASEKSLAEYEKNRIEETAAVVAANRQMQRAGNARSADELAGVTQTYREATRSASAARHA